jgi:hypothetical protein
MRSRVPPAPVVELRIASTWDGEVVGADEEARLRLRLTTTELHIAVAAVFHGDLPPTGPVGPTPRLWEHEVVELFLAGAGSADRALRYTEIELSPWGHHLVLQLEGLRRPIAEGLPLALRTRRRGGRWHAAARLDRRLLPPPPWRANAFAVHGRHPHRRYLAATPLPGPEPDFHQPDRFPPLPLAAPG